MPQIMKSSRKGLGLGFGFEKAGIEAQAYQWLIGVHKSVREARRERGAQAEKTIGRAQGGWSCARCLCVLGIMQACMHCAIFKKILLISFRTNGSFGKRTLKTKNKKESERGITRQGIQC